ncbi:MAG TPA: EAL domain-containing protein [Terracidiphilus sp.]|nr:EAL domain-containing protein [Terracidiphilus sp.]
MAAALAWSKIGLNLPENADSRQQREILDALPVLVFLERAGLIVFANIEAQHAMGHEGDWVSRPVEDVLWGLFPGTAEPRTALTGSNRGSPFHATLAGKGGRLTAVEGTYSILNPELREGIIVAQVGGRDRTPRPRLMEDVLASIPEAVIITHGSHVLYTNPAFTTMFGYTSDEVSGGDLRHFTVPETRMHEPAMLEKIVDDQGRASLETVRLTKNGDLIDVALHVAPLRVNGDKAGYVVTCRDIGERRQVEIKLQHDAMHDVLTGLPNRALFMDRLKLALSRRERRRDQTCAVMFLDLDHFKSINDTLGHAVGDILLVSVAERIGSVLRPHDTAARLGGDEFAILVENIVVIGDLEAVARRVLGELDRPFDVLGHRILAPISIGVSIAREGHNTAEAMVRDADLAMYRAKQEGGHRFTIFDRQMEVLASTEQEREADLRRIVSKREYEFWYQPVFELKAGRVEGFEALLRLPTPSGAFQSFRDLLPLADESGLSISLGRDTLESACRQLFHWNQLIPGNCLSLSINLTGRQFYHSDQVPQLGRIISAAAVNPERLIFDVSEATLNVDPDQAVSVLQRMVDLGVRVALDNFGANLAPLNHLLRLPLDIVKLDAKLTAAATGSAKQRATVESLLHVCRAVGARMLAQGIETHEQLRVMQELGCELGQGYLLAPELDPARADQFATRISRTPA